MVITPYIFLDSQSSSGKPYTRDIFCTGLLNGFKKIIAEIT